MDETAGRVGGAVAGVAAIGAACVAYGVLLERHWYRLRHETVPVLEPDQPPRTILHLSDFHLLARDGRRRRFLTELAGLQVDLVVVTGDILGEPAALEVALESLRRFRPRAGAVAVLGSNDYYPPRFKNYFAYFLPRQRRRLPRTHNPWRELVDGLEGMGWLVLSNERARLGDLEVAGMDDPHIHLDDLDVAAQRDGDGTGMRIGVVHSPYQRSLDAFERAGYQLVLAGHTHGGQVRLPGIGALVTNCDLPRDRVRGLSRWGSSWLHVSGGLGTSKYAPFRFACRPEASLLTLVPA
ncbi:MAG TPA: metallophosphoesterase [Actinomycetes bacterium]|jgi:predicted MPP superfamily phosphohydrolase|nr:metallophosphoesterase [Actinomycetes bacterium]